MEIDFKNILVDRNVLLEVIESNDSMKIEAIRYLLSFEGNKKINKTWFGFTNREKQEEYDAMISTKFPKLSYCSNQFVALYLITAIYHSDKEFCEKIELKYTTKKGEFKKITNIKGRFKETKLLSKNRNNQYKIKYRNSDNKILKYIYTCYNNWFEKLEVNGFEVMHEPTCDNKIEWG